MADLIEQAVFVREFLFSFFENHLLSGLISTNEYYRYTSSLNDDIHLEAVSQRLFAGSPEPVEIGEYGAFRIVHLREPDDSKFPFLQRMLRNDSRRELTCFVGHRFLKGIERS